MTPLGLTSYLARSLVRDIGIAVVDAFMTEFVKSMLRFHTSRAVES